MGNKDFLHKVQPIFVVGVPRSGTTLIGNYVGSCKSVCNLGEYAGLFFSHHIAVREYLKVPTPYKDQYIKELQEHAKSFANKIAVEQSCHFYCDSTPWNLLIAREIADIFPNAIFILTLRHYYGVLQSLKRSYQDGFQWAGSTWTERAQIWRNFYANVHFLPQSRTIPISYEKLCANPTDTIANFKNSLVNLVRLDASAFDDSQFAKSHATKSVRPTIGKQNPDTGTILLRKISSFEVEDWNESIEKEVCPITKNIDDLLKQLFPDSYMEPMTYSKGVTLSELWQDRKIQHKNHVTKEKNDNLDSNDAEFCGLANDDYIETLLAPYRTNSEVLGIVLVGSGSRHYRDALSDYDFEVIVRDDYYGTLNKKERFIPNYYDETTNAEFLILPETDFLAKKHSPKDIDHWPYEDCIVLHDPISFLENQLPLIIAMPVEVRDARLKLHYFEFLYAANRMSNLLQRGDELNARLVAAQSVFTAIKVVFILRYRWPPVVHWSSQNLMQLEEIPFHLKSLLVDILKQPNVSETNSLIREIDGLLEKENLPYSLSKNALAGEVGGAEFRTIRENYGSL